MPLEPMRLCTRCRSRQQMPDSPLCRVCRYGKRETKPAEDGYRQRRTDGKLDPVFVAWFKMEVERLNRK